MSRLIRSYRGRRRSWVALGLATTMLVACGKEPPEPKEVVVEPDSPPEVVPTGGLSPSIKEPDKTVVRVTPATFEEAESVFKTGRYAEAKALFESYASTKPDNPWGHYMLGLAAWKSGDFKAAEQAFERALAVDSTHQKSYLGSARVLLDQKREHEALERVEKALSLDSTSAESLRLLARAKSELGDVDGALESYRKALILDDKDYWTLNNLGVFYLDRGNPESAVGPLARAVELKGTAPVFQNNLGMALERAGHLGDARSAYRSAVKADSTYRKAVKNLERLESIVTDSTGTDGEFVKEQAEVFRLMIQMWKDSAR